MTVSNSSESNTPKDIRDKWVTPQWLFDYADSLIGFDVDLAADEENAKCTYYLGEISNSLQQDWSEFGSAGWLNPPYSNIAPWVEKAWEQAQSGFTTVMLLPTPNGESYYGKYVFGKASEIIYINGRIAFEAADDFVVAGKNGKPDQLIKKGELLSGNPRGSCLIIFSRRYEGVTNIAHIDRDEIKRRVT